MTDRTASLEEKLTRIRDAFLRQVPEQMAGIYQAYEQVVREGGGDRTALEDLHRRIHTLRGASASFGLADLSAAAAAAEGLAKGALEAAGIPDPLWHGEMRECLDRMAEAKSFGSAHQDDAQGYSALSTAASEGRGKLVYLCDDDPFVCSTLSAQLACFGFEVIKFGTLEALDEAMAKSCPDAVVMDMMFPGRPFGGGDYLCRFNAERKNPIPTVFISSQDDISFRLAAVRAGCSAYFVKPVNAAELCATLSNLTRVEKIDPYRVLIIDDDPHLSAVNTLILEDAGMLTRVVHDPLQVMPHLIDFRPDLILMDMHMPGCNGMELARAIRQIPSCFSIPIVFLSTETNVDLQFGAMRMGGDEFLTKPIRARHLVTSVAVRAERMKIIRSLMVRDGMTGLYNHTATKEQLEAAIARERRIDGNLCFAMIDVDHFKRVNDTWGHPAGDRVLIALAGMLRQRLRAEDIVGRIGGEEFAVILPGSVLEDAVSLLDRIRESFAAMRFGEGEETFAVTFSCGVASLSDFDSAAALCKAADEALYKAKSERNRVVAARRDG